MNLQLLEDFHLKNSESFKKDVRNNCTWRHQWTLIFLIIIILQKEKLYFTYLVLCDYSSSCVSSVIKPSRASGGDYTAGSLLSWLYNSYFISFCCVWCLMSHRSLFDTTLTFIIIMRCSDSACRISGISACDEEFIISSLNFFYSEPFYFTAETCSLIPLKFVIESSWSSPGSYRYHENTQISLPLKEQFTQQWKANHLLLLMM